MTRDEMREKVKADIEFYYGNSSDVTPLAEDILSTIFTALQEPTDLMISKGILAYNGKCEEAFSAMLSASPLAPKGKE